MSFSYSDFIVTRFRDLEVPRSEESIVYNLNYMKNLLIKGVLSTEGNLASLEDIELLTTRRFSSLKFSNELREKDIQEVWAMQKAYYFLEENFYKPITKEIVEIYNSLVVVGYKSRHAGRLRETNVFIDGSLYCPPDFSLLPRLYENMFLEVETIEGGINRAFSYALAISKNQFFIDGNKRTALLVALHCLAGAGQPLLVMKNDFSLRYLKGLKEFYETGDNSVADVLYDNLDINH